MSSPGMAAATRLELGLLMLKKVKFRTPPKYHLAPEAGIGKYYHGSKGGGGVLGVRIHPPPDLFGETLKLQKEGKKTVTRTPPPPPFQNPVSVPGAYDLPSVISQMVSMSLEIQKKKALFIDCLGFMAVHLRNTSRGPISRI